MKHTYHALALVCLILCLGSPLLYAQNQDKQEDKIVSLTFDDGPSPKTTGRILDILKSEKVKATFFVLGVQAERYPDLIRRIHNEGHEIGNHTYDHKNLKKLTLDRIREQIRKTQTFLNEEHLNISWFRPPYGSGRSIASKIAQEFNLKTVLWTLDTRDWQKKTSASVEEAIEKDVKDGEIILMHDTKQVTVRALESVIKQLKKRKYEFLTLSQRESYLSKPPNNLRLSEMKDTSLHKPENEIG